MHTCIQMAVYVGTFAKVLKGQQALHPHIGKFYTYIASFLLRKNIQFHAFAPCFILHGGVDATMVDNI